MFQLLLLPNIALFICTLYVTLYLSNIFHLLKIKIQNINLLIKHQNQQYDANMTTSAGKCDLRICSTTKNEFSDLNRFKSDSNVVLQYFLPNLFSFYRGNIVKVGGYHKY